MNYKEDSFLIRTYTKAELAHLYNPHVCLKVALQILRRWIIYNLPLLHLSLIHISMRDEDTVGAHARGYNAISLGVCYEGGLDENGKAADTRTPRQKEALHRLVHELLQRYPEAKVVGHRDLSPDTNYNGIVDPWERIKECPCFEVIGEFSIN